MIEARDVMVALGRNTILRGVDFEAAPAEVTAIIGANGSGKTTLLRALSGDLRYSGSIRVNGKEISTLKPAPAAALRAVLPQSSALSFPFTVREIVRLGLTGGRSGVPDREGERLPERALGRVDLDGFASRFYQELSGGEQQRVQLARVLCQVWVPVLEGSARWLMLDEPVSNLDIRHQLIIMEIARDFARQGGGVVAVLHDLNLAAMFADRLLVMRGGRVVAAGSPNDVLVDTVLEEAYGCRLRVGTVPTAGTPFVLPQSATSAF